MRGKERESERRLKRGGGRHHYLPAQRPSAEVLVHWGPSHQWELSTLTACVGILALAAADQAAVGIRHPLAVWPTFVLRSEVGVLHSCLGWTVLLGVTLKHQ